MFQSLTVLNLIPFSNYEATLNNVDIYYFIYFIDQILKLPIPLTEGLQAVYK